MIEFEVRRPLHGLSDAKVWSLVKDVSAMPRFWRGHREVIVLGSRGPDYELRVRFAFPGPGNRGLARAHVDEAAMSVRIEYLRGPISGVVVTEVKDGELITRWSVRGKGVLRLLEPWLRGHFMKGAREALERIVREASQS
ncbi:MAG: SRPBCC family protein [Acidilobus sp.]